MMSGLKTASLWPNLGENRSFEVFYSKIIFTEAEPESPNKS